MGKSSLSFANGKCVEVASLSGGAISVRDSPTAERSVLTLPATSGMRSSAMYGTAISIPGCQDRITAQAPGKPSPIQRIERARCQRRPNFDPLAAGQGQYSGVADTRVAADAFRAAMVIV
jgi:Domain of unknown function (DUF397)